MKRLIPLILAAVTLAACATTPPPPPPPPPPPVAEPPSPAVFRAQDFAWSTVSGANRIDGSLVFRPGGARYTCAGSSVVLTPETLWSRRRITILYGSPTAAAVPRSTVVARQPAAPNADYSQFVRTQVCDANDRFSFSGLPDGAWFLITVAKPASGTGEQVAIMRRVETRGGRPVSAVLNGAN